MPLKPVTPQMARIELNQQKLEQGIIGGIFGSRKHAPTNLAGLVIVGLLVVTVFIAMSDYDFSAKKELMQILLACLALALGYLFGVKTTA